LKSQEVEKNTTKKTKALALVSGGLDSMLAVKLLLDNGVDVEAASFFSPFCLCDKCSLNNFIRDLKIKIHRISMGKEFLKLVVNPPHGYGSQMNPCIDCRILMFKRAKDLAKKIDAKFLVTGEVLDQRPFSQRKESMFHIEKEAGLEGRILRPLSAKLLPQTIPEKEGLIDKEMLRKIKGRRRLPQIELAKNIGLKDYPCPSGGCLLTDPRFADRLKEHLKHKKKLVLEDILLLKIGRHFRIDGVKLVVGRNENENKLLRLIAENRKLTYLEAQDYNGPTTVICEKATLDLLKNAGSITLRYSDAPKDTQTKVVFRNSEVESLVINAMNENNVEKLII
jgi:tRNA U34 2-thiouridine synthase MnmA/TrmU